MWMTCGGNGDGFALRSAAFAWSCWCIGGCVVGSRIYSNVTFVYSTENWDTSNRGPIQCFKVVETVAYHPQWTEATIVNKLTFLLLWADVPVTVILWSALLFCCPVLHNLWYIFIPTLTLLLSCVVLFGCFLAIGLDKVNYSSSTLTSI